MATTPPGSEHTWTNRTNAPDAPPGHKLMRTNALDAPPCHKPVWTNCSSALDVKLSPSGRESVCVTGSVPVEKLCRESRTKLCKEHGTKLRRVGELVGGNKVDHTDVVESLGRADVARLVETKVESTSEVESVEVSKLAISAKNNIKIAEASGRVDESEVDTNVTKSGQPGGRGTSASESAVPKSARVSGAAAAGATGEASVAAERTFTIEEIVELGDDCLGLRVVVQARGVSPYMGVISYILPASRRLALEKVSNPKTGKKRVGLLTFFFHTVLGVTVVGEDRDARQRLLKEVYQEEQSGRQLLMKKLVPLHLMEPSHLTKGKGAAGGAGGRGEEGGGESEEPPPPPPPPRVSRPSKWVVIDAVDEAYKKAVSLLSAEPVISVSAVGRALGRSGSLALLAAATPHLIFLFDMAKVGPGEVLEAGLGEVLTDEGVVKVVHDCRPLEDLLHHQFGLNFANVFDTQAAEVYVYMLNHRGCVPSFVSSLPVLLLRYLDLAPCHSSLAHHQESDESMWFERPLPPGLCEGVARTVRYLRELRLALIDLMLVDLAQITNIYLGALRDKDSTTVGTLESHVVPAEVQRLARRSVLNTPGTLDPHLPFTRWLTPRSNRVGQAGQAGRSVVSGRSGR